MLSINTSEALKPLETIDDWVAEIDKLRLPVVARTAQSASKVISDDDSSASDLTEVIMRDPSMSARLLRIANSTLHRTRLGTTEDINRAVVNLGYDNIRALTNSLVLVEGLLKDDSKDIVLKEMAHGFHAAAQAKSLMERQSPKKSGEVFVAALLYRLGKLAFWCLPEKYTYGLKQALAENPHEKPDRIEQRVLGFTLHELTLALADFWDLGSTLKDALAFENSDDPAVVYIVLGHDIADSLEKNAGFKSLPFLVESVSKNLKISEEKVESFILENRDMAADNARAYGAGRVAKHIPTGNIFERENQDPTEVGDGIVLRKAKDNLSAIEDNSSALTSLGAAEKENADNLQEELQQSNADTQTVTSEEHKQVDLKDVSVVVLATDEEEIKTQQEPKENEISRFAQATSRETQEEEKQKRSAKARHQYLKANSFEPDQNKVAGFLRKLPNFIDSKPDMDAFLIATLECVHEGLGMDRTLFAMLTTDKKRLVARQALGKQHDLLAGQFSFLTKPKKGKESLFSRQLVIGQPLMIPADPPAQLLPLLPEYLLEVTGIHGFFSAPIIVNKKPIGMFYCDRSTSGREMDQQAYDSFKHLAEKTNEGLDKLRWSR